MSAPFAVAVAGAQPTADARASCRLNAALSVDLSMYRPAALPVGAVSRDGTLAMPAGNRVLLADAHASRVREVPLVRGNGSQLVVANHVRWDGSAVVISDMSGGQVITANARGAGLTARAVAQPGGELPRLVVLGSLAGGRVIVQPPSAVGFGGSVPVIAMGEGGQRPVVLTRYDPSRRSSLVPTNAGTRMNVVTRETPQLFDESTIWRTSPDGSDVYVIERQVGADTRRSTVRVTRVSAAGDTSFTTALPVGAAAVDSAYVVRVVDDAMRPVIAKFDSPAAARGAYLRAIGYPRPASVVSDVLVSSQQEVWLRGPASGSGDVMWMVLGPDGRVVKRVASPSDVHMVGVGQSVIWGVRSPASGKYDLVRCDVR